MNRYLIIQMARFGDLLQSKRLLLSLLAMEEAEVHLCLDSSLAPLAELLFPRVRLHALSSRGGAVAEEQFFKDSRRVFSDLRELEFKQVYNLNYSGMNLAISTLFDPDIVRGHKLASGQPLKDKWMNMAFRWSGQRRLSPINLMDFWGLLAPDPISPEAVNQPVDSGGGGIGVVLAGRHSRRSLPIPVLLPVVTAASGRFSDKPVLLLGEKTEQGLAREFMIQAGPAMRGRIDDRTGKTDWSALIDLVGALDLLITPDTGVMHLAAHLGVSVEAFFLSSAWAFETGPYGLGHRIWQATAECLPCLESQTCLNNMECLTPFNDRKILRAIAGRFDGLAPAGVALLGSVFDNVGVTYRPLWGELNRQEPARNKMRALISEWSGFGLANLEALEAEVDLLFREQDWMI